PLIALSFVPSVVFGFIYTDLSFFLPKVQGLSNFWMGVTIGVMAISLVLASFPLGILADRYGRRRMLILGNAAASLSLIGFALTQSGAYPPGRGGGGNWRSSLRSLRERITCRQGGRRKENAGVLTHRVPWMDCGSTGRLRRLICNSATVVRAECCTGTRGPVPDRRLARSLGN